MWWYCQSCWYYDSFLLGYNDYGHFVQRLQNTIGGQGLLIETPVLPRFWDHLILDCCCCCHCGLPARCAPIVHLAIRSVIDERLLIFRIARALGHNRTQASVWGVAWLMQPAVGQMNLAYTYGWHPITMAIPLLLATIWLSCDNAAG